jgi:hypothetical protein
MARLMMIKSGSTSMTSDYTQLNGKTLTVEEFRIHAII